jgi:succinate dehydrogenase/fumarate reductase flavoprotein subunit
MSGASAHRSPARDVPQESCDVLVIGSGAGGLSAAVTAAHHGLRVVVAEKEKEAVFGGTSAWSGGWLWIPRNRHAVAAGIVEDAEAPRTYLRHELGDGFEAAKVDAFLAEGPRMVDFFEVDTEVRFVPGNAVPDFHGRAPGAVTGGRSVCAAPYDGRRIGPLIERLRPPLREVTVFGMGIASDADLKHFLNATRASASALHVARRLGRHALDLVRHRRGMQLVNGNALVARLLRSAADAGVELREATTAVRLLLRGGRVTGAVLRGPTGERAVEARRGVVLAAGGFPHDPARQAAMFGHVAAGGAHHSAAPPANTGDGLRLGEQAGGAVVRDFASPAAWAPVSCVPRRDGTDAHFPHLIERAKPGVVAVTADGRRFVNEAGSYHDFMRGLLAAVPPDQEVAAWLVCDHRFQRRYGLGFAKPFPFPLGPVLRSGYLKRGATPERLARACGIDPAGHAATLAAWNRHAQEGRDPEFDRGGTPYERVQGDADHPGPNPCVAPIGRGPFYAVKIVPGSLGTFAGLRTDERARVLDAAGASIPGLYAAGNDMANVMAGNYPSGGITLGPAMTFGYIAARDMAADAAAVPEQRGDAHHAAL